MTTTILRKWLVVLILFICSQSGFCQLSDFTFSATKTDESCTGNGTLSFAVSGTVAGATVAYSIYKLPEISTPIATLTANTFGGLTAGNYRIIAVQTSGNMHNQQQQDISINNTVVPLLYTLSGSINCSESYISAQVIRGNAIGFEIISGPVLKPRQLSNTFTGLMAGTYVIRVYDNCEDAVVQTFTLRNAAAAYTVGPLMLPQCALSGCNQINVGNTLLNVPGFPAVNLPATVEYTIFPPSGNPIVRTVTTTSVNVSTTIPFYDVPYFVNVRVTDRCGIVAESNNNQVNLQLSISSIRNPGTCLNNIKLNICNFASPYAVAFIAAPAGFNPALYNTNGSGIFSDIEILYSSTQNNQMPAGTYVIKITDACGRTKQTQIVLDEFPEPKYEVIPQGCDLGEIHIPNATGTLVTSVIMTGAPVSYNHTMPYDVSSNISNGKFEMPMLPIGTYTFTVLDVCGRTYNYTIVIPPGLPQPLQINSLKGCVDGRLSLELKYGMITAISIIAAPVSYPRILPANVSGNINSEGVFYVNDLVEGLYTFSVTNSCGSTSPATVFLPGFHVLQNNVTVDAHCGAFDLFVGYHSNETWSESKQNIYLQKLDPATGNWVHPITNLTDLAGSQINNLNTYTLANDSNTLNIVAFGNFRVVVTHLIYGNSTDAKTMCVTPIKEFTFTGGPRIIDVFALPCSNNLTNVVVTAEGLPPLSYDITTKNGSAYEIPTSTSNLFTQLSPGVYNFQVSDSCGNIVNRPLDLTTIPAPAIEASNLCNAQNGQLSVPNLPYLNYQWWKESSPANILSTTNVLGFTPFSTIVNSGIYKVRLYAAVPNLCTDQTIPYEILPAGSIVSAGLGTTTELCGNTASIDLFTKLSGTYQQNGIWEEITNSGMLIGHNWSPFEIPFGTYKFKYTVTGLCGQQSQAIVTINYNAPLAAPVASVLESGCNTGTVHLLASDIANATYHWTGPNSFISDEQNPVVAGIASQTNGTYFVTSTIGSCSSIAVPVQVALQESLVFSVVTDCKGNEFQVEAIYNDSADIPADAIFNWTGPNNYSGTGNPITITGGDKGKYKVTLTGSALCPVSSEIEIGNTVCTIPGGLSPDGDGKNDVFDLTGFDVLNLKIFSRYGRIVFEQENYTNQWHGQDYKNRNLPDATYYYYIRMKSGEERTGWVYVVN